MITNFWRIGELFYYDFQENLTMDHFILHSEYAPMGDQPQAIEELVEGFKEFFPENAVEYFVS